jgi:hypothetical protein
MAGSLHKHDAQRRADQIRAFRRELAALEEERVEALTPDRRVLVFAHQDALLTSFARSFDIDRSEAGQQLSLGMRLASAFGAAALIAAIVSFFYRIWGTLAVPAQVGLLTAAPLAALGAMLVAARRERTLYIASLCAIVACGAFVLQTIMLGDLFNMRGSAHVLAVWAAFGFTVALPFRLPIPFAGAVAAAVSYVAALLIMETVLLPAAGAYAAWSAAPRELQPWARGTTLVMALAAVIALSTFESASVLPIGRRSIAWLYQVVAAFLSFAVVWHGLRTGRREVVVIGAGFAAIFLLGRFVDWWWDWMPKYLFFLILASLAIASIWLLRRMRARFETA